MAADNTVRVDVILDSKTKGIEKGTAKTKQLREENERLSKVFQEVEKDAKSLDDRIDALTTHRLRLAQQLSENDDVELRKEFNRTNQRVSFFKKLQNVIVEGGKFTGKNGAKVLDFGGEGIRPRNAAMGIGAAALAPAVVPLGAMLGGAISGTTVGAAMAGGILAASRDPSVVSAAGQFGETISKEFFASGDAFAGPIRNSLNILEADFQDLELESLFAKVAPQVETVAHGIGDLAKNLMPGLNKTLDRSSAFTEEFAEGLGDLGGALGQMSDDMSSSEGAVEGLNTLFMLVNGTLVALGKTVNALSDTWDAYTDVMAGVSGALEDIPEWLQIAVFGHNGFAGANDVMEELNSSGFDAANAIGEVGHSSGDAAKSVEELVAQIRLAHDATLKWLGTEINAEQAIDDLAESLKENGLSFDMDTEAGRKNQRAVQDIAQSAKDAAQAKYDETHSVESAQRVYDGYRNDLIKTLIQAGKTKEEAKRLADAWLGVPGRVDTVIVTTYVSRAQDWTEFRKAERQAEGRAHGGPVMAGVPYKINERGMETVTFPAGGTVHPANLTPMTGGSGGMVARPLNLNGAGLGDMVFNWLVREVGNRGGTLAVLGIRE